MNPTPPPHSGKLADQLMAIEVFSELLASTDPQQLGRRLTEQLRELTGARTVALLAHPAPGTPHSLIHVCPERRSEIFSTAELDLICPECTSPLLPPLTAQLPPGHPLRVMLQREKVESLLRIPLRAREEIVSTLLLLNLPEPARINEVATAIRHLAPVIALALKNAFAQERIAQQAQALQAQTAELERRVAERTAALEEANRSLTSSRLDALRLMEEAVAARERAERTNADLQREISERQRAETKLRESEARLTQALEMTHLAHWEFDAASATLLFNDRFYALYGTTADREGGYRMPAAVYAREFLLPEEIHLVHDEIVRALDSTSTESSWQLEHRIRRRDGAIRHISVQIVVVKDEAGHTIGTRGANQDITERKQAEAELRQTRAILQVAMDQSPAGIAIADAPDGILRYVNDSGLAMGGGNRATIVDGVGIDRYVASWKLLDLDGQPLATEQIPMVRALTRGEAARREFIIRRGENDDCTVVSHAAPIRDDSGRIVAGVVVFLDITELKRAERELEQFFSLVPDLVCIASGDGFFRKLSDEWVRVLGYSKEELMAVPYREFIHPDDRAATRHESDQQAAGNSSANFVNRYRAKDGSYRWLEWNATAATPAGLLFAAARDITRHRQAEEALRESEEKFAKVFHAAPAWIGITDLVDATYVDINEEALRLSGFTREEVIGHTSTELGWLSAEERARLAQNVQAHGRVAGLELTLRAKDGRPLSGWLSSELIGIRGRPCLLTVIVDITERKRTEETLAWEAALVENSADVCSIKDLDLRVRAVNKAFLASAGVATAAEVLGKTDVEIFGRPGNEANIEGYMADERSAQQLPPGEYISRLETLIRHDGTEQVLLTRKFPVFDAAGQLIATANISTDVTEHQRLEEALHRNVQRYRELFASNVAGVALHEIVCDAAGRPCDYRFLEVNPAFEKLTGLTAAGLVGRTVLEVLPGTEPLWIERYGRVALTGEATHFDQFSTVLDRHFEVSAYSPQIGQFAVLVLDITERKGAEAALRESLREKEALLKEVHHRVKNNLQVISSLLRLEAGRVNDPVTQAVLRDMQNRIRTMALLHESLYRSGNLAEVDMQAYLGTLCQQLFRVSAARSTGPVELQMAVAPMRLELNRTVPCGLIVNELVSNCLKHAFPGERGGRVLVELQPTLVTEEWILRVSDDGVGLPAGFTLEQLPSLGLQLVSDLSRQLQGRLEIAPGTGATAAGTGAAFTIYFKVSPPEQRPAP